LIVSCISLSNWVDGELPSFKYVVGHETVFVVNVVVARRTGITPLTRDRDHDAILTRIFPCFCQVYCKSFHRSTLWHVTCVSHWVAPFVLQMIRGRQKKRGAIFQ
jgi:hypothetical protein